MVAHLEISALVLPLPCEPKQWSASSRRSEVPQYLETAHREVQEALKPRRIEFATAPRQVCVAQDNATTLEQPKEGLSGSALRC